MDEALRPFGLTTFQYTALTVLQHRGTLSSRPVGPPLLRPTPDDARDRASLEERGLIERAHAPGNRRTMEARLTREGEELLAACAPAVQKLEDRLLHGMPENRRSAFRRACRTGSSP